LLATLLAVTAVVLAAASGARAHTDPPGCFSPAVALVLHAFRADGVTPLTGSATECETIQYRVTLQKAGGPETCAFEGGSVTLTTPDGVVHPITSSVPCIGGTTAGCTATQFQSGLIAYGVRSADVVGGSVLAQAQYVGGTAHTFGSHMGVSATSQNTTPIVFCEDGSACTVDTCDPLAGCRRTSLDCNDGDLCTIDTCNPTTGCAHAPRICNDDNLCTFDTCQPATGLCAFTWDSCNDGDRCTEDSCDPLTGCMNVPINCSDGDACTVDACEPSTGSCVYAPKSCDDGNACTVDSCSVVLGCDNAPIECDDYDPCTVDACNSSNGACASTPIAGCDGTYRIIGEHGGSATTDIEGDGATPADPVETTIILPGPGVVTIAETNDVTTTPPAGYAIFGQQVVISAPWEPATNPIVLSFRLDASILPDPTGDGIQVLRDGVPIVDCNGAAGTAAPDPCHASTTILPDGDVEYVVLTTHASVWNFVVPALVETGIAASKLEIVQDEIATGKAKLTWVGKDRTPGAIAKGPAGSPADLAGTFEVFYADAPGNHGRFSLPSAGWTFNSAGAARYLNRLAPGGDAAQATTGQGVKSAVVKPDRQAKVSAKSRGEDAAKIDLLAGSISPSGLVTVLTIENAADGFVHRMCTSFANADVVVNPLGGGTGRRLTARRGVPTACP
jgi:hypothetical protein